MKHPERWRECADPFALPFHRFVLKEVIGYPHAGNDVFQVTGYDQQREVEAYIKVARQTGADIKNEIFTIKSLNSSLAPQIIDYDEEGTFVVTLAKRGERLSFLVGDNQSLASLDYLYEYGQTLARLHKTKGTFPKVKDRRFFHIPEQSYFESNHLEFVYRYLVSRQSHEINECFCHGDFHYANILWENKHISAILDYELSGIGNREFDVAWALILRPGQRFFHTEEEIQLFLRGYQSLEMLNLDNLEYYMILIYSYFYQIGKDFPDYQKYVMGIFERYCRG